TDWRGGSTHFTTDSSRVLVASFGGPFQWFKLPGGEPDGGWTFGTQGGGIQHAVGGVSGDGRVIGHAGRGKQGAPLEIRPHLLDGATGADLWQIPREYDNHTAPVVSRDGRLAALKRARVPNSNTVTFEVLDVAT